MWPLGEGLSAGNLTVHLTAVNHSTVLSLTALQQVTQPDNTQMQTLNALNMLATERFSFDIILTFPSTRDGTQSAKTGSQKNKLTEILRYLNLCLTSLNI